MIKDKRIEWCKKHCIDIAGDTYIKNLNFNDQEYIEIELNVYNWLILKFDGEQLPDFIVFKVNKLYVSELNIDIEKCSHLKSWKRLPTEKVNHIWLGSELEDIDSLPMCNLIDHSFINDEHKRHRINKKLKTKLWQKFKSEVLNKLQEQNSDINISDYQDGIEWLAIHNTNFYKEIIENKFSFTNNEIISNSWSVFESIASIPPTTIKINSNFCSELYIDDDFNYSLAEKLMNNIYSKNYEKIYLPNQEGSISKDDFLRLAEEKNKQDIIESKKKNKKHPKNK